MDNNVDGVNLLVDIYPYLSVAHPRMPSKSAHFFQRSFLIGLSPHRELFLSELNKNSVNDGKNK